MAVPSSGTITLLGLAQEALYGTYGSGSITYPIAMYDLVNGGNSQGSGNSYPAVNQNCMSITTPHEMSEWYGYAKNCSPSTGNTQYSSSSAYTTEISACNSTYLGNSFWHNGQGTYPISGDGVWYNEDHSTSLSDNYYRIGNGTVLKIVSDEVEFVSLCP